MKKARKAISVLMAAVLTAGVSAPAAFAAAPHVQSDTTMDFTVDRGNTYAFKFTVIGSHSNPQIAAGNGVVLRTENTVKKVENGNDTYYFKVRAIGSCGQESAVYTTLPGQSAVRHCKIKVGVQHHKDDKEEDGLVFYYAGEVQNKYGRYVQDAQLSASRKKQYLIDYMNYMGYTHNASLDSANVWTTPTSEEYSPITSYDYAANIEKGLETTAKDLITEMKKHNTTKFGVHTTPYVYEKQQEQIIPTFKSNLTYDTNPDPVFTSKYYTSHLKKWFAVNSAVTSEGGNMGCNEYVCGRAKEVTGITLNGSILSLIPKALNTEEVDKIKAAGYTIGTEPKKDSIAIQPDIGSYLGHFEYVENVNGDDVILSGGNGKYEPGDGIYYGRVTRTKSTLEKWNTVYIYLK